jgi:hypothetical protein
MAVPTKLASSNQTEHKLSTPMLHVLQPTSVVATSNTLFTITSNDQDDSMGQHSTSPPLAPLLAPPSSSSANGRHYHQHNGPIVISLAAPSTGDYYPVSRPTRESVLQRLSEGLLRRSLTKVSYSLRSRLLYARVIQWQLPSLKYQPLALLLFFRLIFPNVGFDPPMLVWSKWHFLRMQILPYSN